MASRIRARQPVEVTGGPRPPDPAGTGIGRLESTFARLRRQGKKALITYVTAGDPSGEATVSAGVAMAGAGADVVEIGIPFSDPLADGPTIQQASRRALAAGTTPARVLEWVVRLRGLTPIPLVLLSYVNPLLQYGPERFCRDAARAGADGLIVPDLPLEEADLLGPAAETAGLAMVPLVAPTTPPGRLAAICGRARGFVYAVSLVGVTGARENLSQRLAPLVAAVRAVTSLPVAAGFGIATPEQARQAARQADGVVVGSALVSLAARGGGPEAVAARVAGLVAELRRALDGPGEPETPVTRGVGAAPAE